MTLLLSHSRKLFPLVRLVGILYMKIVQIWRFVCTELTPSQYCDFQLRPISYALLLYMGCYMIFAPLSVRHCTQSRSVSYWVSVTESWVWSMKGIALRMPDQTGSNVGCVCRLLLMFNNETACTTVWSLLWLSIEMARLSGASQVALRMPVLKSPGCLESPNMQLR